MTTTATKERPILFSGEMVLAILDGRKTQTRRVIKPQPESLDHDVWKLGEKILTGDEMREHLFHNVYGTKGTPYGALWAHGGDRLWVRETWAAYTKPSYEYPDDCDLINDCAPRDMQELYGTTRHDCVYRADGPNYSKWRPSILMPRWASRLTLEITDVRVERLNEISDEDAIAEGVQCAGVPASLTNRGAFAKLWESINGPGSWAANPWVWAITFKRVSQ